MSQVAPPARERTTRPLPTFVISVSTVAVGIMLSGKGPSRCKPAVPGLPALGRDETAGPPGGVCPRKGASSSDGGPWKSASSSDGNGEASKGVDSPGNGGEECEGDPCGRGGEESEGADPSDPPRRSFD